MAQYRTSLAVVLIAAAAVRVWGLGFGLPHTLCRPDEEIVVSSALRFFTGDLNPHFFNYPTAFLYLTALLDGAWFAIGRAAGWFTSLGQFVTDGLSRPAPLYLLARGLSAAAGTASVWLVARIGRRAHSPAAGLMAATLLALTFLHVRDSHFAVTDVTATLFALASIDAAMRSASGASTGSLLLAAAAGGLAASTKYNAGLVLLPILWLAVTAARPWSGRLRLAAAVVATASAAFVVSSPFVLLDPRQFLSDFAWESGHLARGHGIALGRGWIVHLTSSLRYGVGLPILVAGVVGLAAAVRRHPRTGLALVLFPLASYLTLGSGYTVFARYMVPVVPFLCLGAGLAAADAGSWLAGSAGRRGWTVGVAWALTAALVAPTAATSWTLDRLLARTDNRVLASDWIVREYPDAASVFQNGERYGQVQFPARSSLASSRVDFDEATSTFRAPDGRTIDPPDLVVLQSSPLTLYSAVPGGLMRVLERRYRLMRTFQAWRPEPGAAYDQSDAFFLPLHGFGGVERPGPNLAVYARRDQGRDPGSPPPP